MIRWNASAGRLTAEPNAGQELQDAIRHFCQRLRRGCCLFRNSFDFVDALQAFRGITSIGVYNGPSGRFPKIPATALMLEWRSVLDSRKTHSSLGVFPWCPTHGSQRP